MAKVGITVQGADGGSIFPAFIIGSAAAASGDDVVLFFTPGASLALLPGELEKIKAKGMPDVKELCDSLLTLGGRIIICELVTGAKDLKKEDFIDGVELMMASGFLDAISDAQITFSF